MTSTWIPLEFTRTCKARTPSPQRISVQGKNMALYWDVKRDLPVIVDDVCPHRGASLSAGGKVDGSGCITCKYHGKRICGKHKGLVDMNGIVWMKDGHGALPAHERQPPHTWEFDSVRNGTMRVIEYVRGFEGCNPILLVENTLDFSHLESVHAFHLIEGRPDVTVLQGGYNGKASYRYEAKGFELTVENEYWGPWETCLRFFINDTHAFTLHFSVRAETSTDATLLVRVTRPCKSTPRNPLSELMQRAIDLVYVGVNELPLVEDRFVVRHADASSWSKNVLTSDDAFLIEYREYMTDAHPDILERYVMEP
jgi:phenylpropionate dioxygenase-like ring-hydroxylating dioxygenase large terminal subunit